jgi:hypothetical protein
MAIIDPDGLFSGERLAACSDIAQLYWPRFFLAANSCARIELSYKSLVSRVFGNFQKVPTSSEIWAIFREYEANYLAVLYETEGGAWWCQFATSEKYLPKYKKTRDNLSPAPPADAMDEYRFGYLKWKKSKSFQNQSFQKLPESFSSEGVGIGVGVGEGTGVKQKPSAKGKPSQVKDERNSSFMQDFRKAFEHINHIPAPWDEQEAGILSRWLKKNATITREQWQNILRHRRASPINQTAPLSRWMPLALSWLEGMADEWGNRLDEQGNRITGGKGNGATKPSPNKQDRNIEAGRIASAYYEAQAIGSANGDGGESGRGVESSLFGDSDGNVIDGTF